ncbi:MAG: discoidin domain-containing protein [Bacteroidales bacterium]|nr:discoidin domain-containing protein [Bacteroidales bacterium]
MKKIILFYFLVFNISISNADIVLKETFSSSTTPTGWTINKFQGSYNWVIKDNPGFSSPSGGFYAVFDDESLGAGTTPNEAYIQTNSFDCSGMTSVKVSFYEFWHAVENTHGYFEVSTNGGTTWTIFLDNSGTTVGSLTTPNKTIVDISAIAANQTDVKIRFRYYESGAVGKYWYIDDIVVYSGNDVGVPKLVSPAYLNCGQTYSNAENVTIRLFNYSNEDVTNVSWTVNVSGGQTGSWSGSGINIPADGFVDVFVANLDMSADDIYHFDITATLAGDGYMANNNFKVGRRQYVQTYPYLANFNSSRDGWFEYGDNPTQPNNAIPTHNGRQFSWGNLPYLNGPDGQGNSWFSEVKRYYNGKWDYYWVESPVFDFSENTSPTLSMDIKYSLYHSSYDYFHVEYSLDDGANWTQLGTNADPDWYQGSTNWWTANNSTPINTWTHVQHDLCYLSGETCVKFRIRGRTYYQNDGYYQFAFDNFEISETQADDVEPIALTLTHSKTCSSFNNTEPMQVLLKNNTCRPIYNMPISIQIDGGAIINEIVPGPIPRFDTYLYDFTTTADLSSAGNHTIIVTTNLPTDNNNTNDVLTETRINGIISTYPYLEDFNSGNGGWVSRTPVNHRYFRLQELPYLNGAQGEGNSWHTEITQNGKWDYYWVESPVFNLNGVSNPTLFLDVKYSLYHSSYNYVHVEYSTNGGSTWTQLGTSADPFWYNGSTNWWTANNTNPVDEWTTMQHSLCNIAALTPAEKSCVKFRIYARTYYLTDGYNQFAFDNFEITDQPEVGVSALLDPNANASGCLYSSNQTITIEVENFGCGDISDVPVECIITFPAGHPNAPSITLNGIVSTIPAQSSTSYTFTGTFDMTPMGLYNFEAYSQLIGDTHHNNDTVNVDISVDFPKINTFPYLEDFNSGDGYWTAGGDNPPDNNGRKFVHGTLPYLNGPEGEGDCWYTEITTNAKWDYYWVESPVFDFSQNTNPTLSMDIKYSLYHSSYNYVHVEYSLDGGSNWTQLGTNADPDWYQGSTNWWTANNTTPVNTWTHVEHDLCELSGEPCVKFRIKARTYYINVGYNEFAFDNFEISGGESDDAQPIQITLADGGNCSGYSNSENVQVLIINNKCRPLYNIPISIQIDGGAIINEIVPGPINRFDTYLYNFTTTADLSAPGTHTISVTTNLSTDGDNSNNNLTETRINTPINTFPYLADFNADNQGWVSRPDANHRYFRYGEPPYLNGAQGQGNSWYSEVKQNGKWDYYNVESPIFDFTTISNPILYFDVKYSLYHSSYDYVHVEYSTNGGTNWTQLGTSADPNWYSGSTNWWTNNNAAPIEDWTQMQHNLCMLAGQSCVQFRIRALTYYINEGYNQFAFDNFKIIDAQDVGVTKILDPTPDLAGCTFIDNQTVTVRVYNWSCTDATNVPVQCDVTGAATATLTGIVPTVPAQSYTDFTLTGSFDMTPVGTYNLNAYTIFVGDPNNSNDNTSSSIVVEYPKISSFPYIEDFNSGTGYWKAGGDSPNFPPDIETGRNFIHGTLPYLNGSDGEGDCWFTEVTTNAKWYYYWVESPVFDFSSLTEPSIFLDIKYSLYHSSYNYVNLEYSLDGGDTWIQLGTSADYNWYSGSTNWWTANNTNPLIEWTKMQHDVCFLAGEDCVKFRVKARTYYINEGYNQFAFDNFWIYDQITDAAVTEYVTPTEDQEHCTFIENQPVTVTVYNPFCSDLTSVPITCEITGAITQTLIGNVDIPAKTYVNYTFATNIDMRTLGTYYLKTFSSLLTDFNNQNDTIYQSITVNDTLISTFPYFENFNNPTTSKYWTSSGDNPPDNNGRKFVLGQFDYLEGNENNGQSWFTEVTTNGKWDYYWVESPVFDFTGLENPILSMDVKYHLYHTSYDYFHVEYSTNGGVSWLQLGTNSDPNWYSGSTNWWTNNLGNPVDEWTYVEHTLCNLKDETCVKFRIIGRTYYNNPYYYYFAFDNFTISDARIDAEITNLTGCYGQEYNLEVEIANRNNFCQLFDPCGFDGQTSLKFDGSNDMVTIGTLPAFTNFTVEYYVKHNGTDGTYDRITSVAGDRFETTKETNGQLRFYTPATGWRTTAVYLPVGEWTHVAWVSDGSSIKLYVNGENVYNYTANITIPSAEWNFGGKNNNTYSSNINLDEVKIWDIALSEAEIRNGICGSLTGTEPNLVAYYQMEENTGSYSVSDITGNGYNGSLTNMDVNSCWEVSDLAINNGGVATEPDILTSINISYIIDGGATVTNNYAVNIPAGSSDIVTISPITIPNGLDMSNNLAASGIASASSSYAGNSAAAAFDNNITTTGWANNNSLPSWLQVDLGAGNEQAVNAYRVYCSSTQTPGSWNNEQYNPGTWQFQGSNDGSSWTTLDSKVYGNILMNEWKVFTFDNTIPFRYFRINITNAEGSTNYIRITELQMFNVNPPTSELTVWIDSPNGEQDQITINDTIYADVANFPTCNDHCDAAIEIVDAVTNATSNSNATWDPLEDPNFSTTGCSGVTLENTAWYYFTTNCRGGEVSVTFQNIVCSPGGTGIQIAITRLDAEPACDPANHTEVFCAYPGDESDIVWNPLDLYPDTQYYITIDGVSGNTCDFQILLEGNVAFNPIVAMSGDFTIEPSEVNYPSIQAAVDSLEMYGVSGPVHFDVADVPFNEQIQIGTICGVSDVNTITFETWCDDCGQAILEHDADATNNYTLRLYRTSYITFKNFSFNALGNTNGRVIEIAENNHYINFENCTFNGVQTSDNSDNYALIYEFETLTNSSDFNFYNCVFNNGSYGLNLFGKNATQNISGLSLSHNAFNNQSFSGIFLTNVNTPVIINNSIVSISNRTDYRGISLTTCNNESIISQNNVVALQANGYGLFLDNVLGTAGNKALVINNMFSIGNGSGTSYGINIENATGNSGYIDIFFNSSNVLSTNGAGININTADFLSIKNNNFVSASANSFNAAVLTNSTENYNNFMPDFTGKGANSITINPMYLSVDNLHTENAGLQAGDNTTGISTDFDGETRQYPPYIGADEYLGSVIWTGNTNTDWNTVTNWQPNTYISNATNVIIPTTPVGGNFPETNSNIDNLAETKNLTIQTGSHLYIAPNKYLTVWGIMNQNGTFIIQSDATGTGSFINKSTVNYGIETTTVQRYISPLMWHYVSSPITSASVNLFHPNNFYFYDETIEDSWNMQNFSGGLMGWIFPASGSNMNIMQGYITYQNQATVEFTGELNTGEITYNLSYTDNTATHGNSIFDGWNLIGNPYPSTLNWYDNNNITKTNIDGAIYFYIDDGSGAYNNYSYFLPESYTNPYPSVVLNRVSGCIPLSQSFFVKANSPGASITVNNSARIHNDVPFYKSNFEEPNQLRLTAYNNQYTDETILRFIPEATENYDGQLDAIKLVGYSVNVPYLFSLSDDSINLSINSLPEIDTNSILNLGFKTGTAGQFSITMNDFILPDSITPYLIDLQNNTETDLTKNNTYDFYSNIGTYRNRFKIIFKHQTNSNNNTNVINSNILIYSNKMNLFVNFIDIPEPNTTITIFDITGKKIKDINPKNKNNVYELNYLAQGIYNVIIIQNQKIFTKKFILFKN